MSLSGKLTLYYVLKKRLFSLSARYTSYEGIGIGLAPIWSLILKPLQRHQDFQTYQAQGYDNRKQEFFKWIIKCNCKRGPPFPFGSQICVLQLCGKQLHTLNMQYSVCTATSQAHRVLKVHKWLCRQKSFGQGDQIHTQNMSTPVNKASSSPHHRRGQYIQPIIMEYFHFKNLISTSVLESWVHIRGGSHPVLVSGISWCSLHTEPPSLLPWPFCAWS